MQLQAAAAYRCKHLCHDDDEADVVDVGVNRVVPRHRNADLELARQVLSARISV